MVARMDQATDTTLLADLLQARRGTAFFARKLNELGDEELDGASLLPGWSRRHVVAHVGYNARALSRLIEWAATGVETPMYPSPEYRDREILFGATLSPAALRNLFDHSAVHLNVEWRDLSDESWEARVRTAQGRNVAAGETVWLRTREVWVHAVDLANGAGFEDIPDSILRRFLDDITASWRVRGTDQGLRIEVPLDAGTLARGDLASPRARLVTGSLPAITAWAAGRGAKGVSQDRGPLLPAPPWI
ncbi:maleylpyruvate isomerase family mycothiol-dependent enzyme [Arthrobacter sp. NPDC090010]|uniref:maleylpyruvate isomerase family mycothiol-dependent enzyme n=1 Tax=Arthrobacter sp. NPDC090010 TaxID=3363942 RepID=UPI00382326AB